MTDFPDSEVVYLEQSDKLYPIKHKELLTALLSGFLIFLAWRMEQTNQMTAAIITYICAFIIGGFAYTKKGIFKAGKSKQMNIEILLILAAGIACVIGYWTYGTLMIFILAISQSLQSYMMQQSEKELSKLFKWMPNEAALVRGGFDPMKVPVETVKVDDHIFVKTGESIPADGVILKGILSVDESMITNDPTPISKEKGDVVFAGSINLNGRATINVTKNGTDSLLQKMMAMIQTARNEKTNTQKFIERFEQIYLYTLLVLVGLMFFLPHFLFDWEWNITIYRAVTFFVVATPSAFIASALPTTFAAISTCVRQGVFVKSGRHLEKLSSLETIVSKQMDLSSKEVELSQLGIQVVGEQESNTNREIAVISNDKEGPFSGIQLMMSDPYKLESDNGDMIFLRNHLPQLTDTITLAKKMQKIIKQNLLVSIVIIVLLILLNFFQLITLPIATMIHEIGVIIVIGNGLRCLN